MNDVQISIRLKPKARRVRKVVAPISQADRARSLAASCREPMIAELFLIHARVCDQNALKAKGAKGWRRYVAPVRDDQNAKYGQRAYAADQRRTPHTGTSEPFEFKWRPVQNDGAYTGLL